jgi:hypothetical protein
MAGLAHLVGHGLEALGEEISCFLAQGGTAADGEGIVGMGGGSVAVSGEAFQAVGQGSDGSGQLAASPSGKELFIGMVLLQDRQPLQFSVGLGERKHGRVARGDGLDFRIGELLAADILGGADGRFARHHLADKLRFGFECLPHEGVKAPFGDVAVDRHFLILIALAQDAAVALLDFGRLPGGVEVVEGNQAFLHVGAGAHFLRAAQKDPHLARADFLEQRLFLGVGIGVAGGGDMAPGDTTRDEFLGDLVIDRIPPGVGWIPISQKIICVPRVLSVRRQMAATLSTRAFTLELGESVPVAESRRASRASFRPSVVMASALSTRGSTFCERSRP